MLKDAKRPSNPGTNQIEETSKNITKSRPEKGGEPILEREKTRTTLWTSVAADGRVLFSPLARTPPCHSSSARSREMGRVHAAWETAQGPIILEKLANVCLCRRTGSPNINESRSPPDRQTDGGGKEIPTQIHLSNDTAITKSNKDQIKKKSADQTKEGRNDGE